MPSTWTSVDPAVTAHTFTYSFGPGTANTLAYATDGGMVLVSPPCNPTDESFAAIERHGKVRALVAPNAFHHMGLAAWKARYPDAPIFAPAQSVARVSSKSKLADIRSLAEAPKALGDRVELVDMPHYKTGEALVRWKTDGGWAWYLTDVAMNVNARIPGLFGVVFRMTRSTPGFRRNALAGAFTVKDKRSLYAWIHEQAEKTPPKLLVMCHGDPLRPDDPVAAVRAAFG